MSQPRREVGLLTKAVAIPAGAGVIGGKFWLGHKWLEYRRRRRRQREGIGMSARKFAALPRRKQRGIVSYRRQRLRQLEGIYKGQSPRKPDWRV